MFKDTILRRIVVIILLSVLLSAVLTTAAFYYSGGRVFSGIKAKELRPRAEYLANITAEYLQGLITKESYERSIGRGFKVWDASMYAYDACGDHAAICSHIPQMRTAPLIRTQYPAFCKTC